MAAIKVWSMNVVLLGKRQPNVRSLFSNNELGLAIDIGDRNGASEAKRTWRRNLLTYSDQFSNAAWTKNNLTLTTNAASWDGSSTADIFTPTAVNSTHIASWNTIAVTQNRAYTFSVYAKANGLNWIGLNIVNPAVADYWVYFDLSNGVTGTVTAGATPLIESLGNGWYRCSVTVTTTGTQTTANASIGLASANNTLIFLGDAVNGCIIDKAQFELASTPSTYQPITDWNTEFKAAFPNHSLYVDSNGVAPAVYPGDQVGLVIDSSRGGLENLGAEKWVHASVDVNSTESQ
ncbi:MAG: hypothetical protein ACK528_14590, partial [Alphaproteobacteria bacterium]